MKKDNNHSQDLLGYIRNSVEKTLNVARSSKYMGYDKYSLLATPISDIVAKMNNGPGKLLKYVYFWSILYLPSMWILLQRPPKLIHPKAMGLFADAYLDLYFATQREEYKIYAQECLEWLLKNSSPRFPKYCWGVPFVWKSKWGVLPANHPITSVSSICADPFWRFGSAFGYEEYLRVPQLVCDALLKVLYCHTDLPDKYLCFGYTSADRLRVLNGNLFLAEKMFLVGKYFEKKTYIELAEKILNYCLDNVNNDGSFPYQGKESGPEGQVIDAYHNGFILRSLFRIYRLFPREDIFKTMRKGVDAYIANFIRPNGETLVQPNSKIVDIHGCAESILCLGRMMNLFPYCRPLWEKVIRWTIKHMQDYKSGHFYFRQIQVFRKFHWCVKIPFIRWSDAWMSKALAEAILILKTGDVDW